MDIWKHSLLSQRKFGGQPEDYYHIHEFIDSSKLFLFHMKHRVLLHNLYGIELCILVFGNYVVNSANKTILVRDIAAEHCKEDLSGYVPTLYDWFSSFTLEDNFVIPEIHDMELKSFIYKPFLRSNIQSSMIITCSDFGVYLVEKCFGIQTAIEFSKKIPPEQKISTLLKHYTFTNDWQVFTDINELKWLQKNG